MSSYRAIWTHFRQISMIFEQINMHAPLAGFLVGRHNLQTPHPSCMLLAQPAACTGLPCVVHSFWLCLIFCARYSFNSILEAPNLWVRCSRLFFFPEKWPPYFWSVRRALVIHRWLYMRVGKVINGTLSNVNEATSEHLLLGFARTCS